MDKSPVEKAENFLCEVRELQIKHYIAVFPLLYVNFPGYYFQGNGLGFCKFIFV